MTYTNRTHRCSHTGQAFLTLLRETAYTYPQLDGVALPTVEQASRWVITTSNAENGGQWVLSSASGEGDAMTFPFGTENIPSLGDLRRIILTTQGA